MGQVYLGVHAVELANRKAGPVKHLLDGVRICVGAAEPADKPYGHGERAEETPPVLTYERDGNINGGRRREGANDRTADRRWRREKLYWTSDRLGQSRYSLQIVGVLLS
jgi:hypothetical protein